MSLGEYIAAAAERPWHWATHDCCTFIADWAVSVGWDDPMAFIRGTYEGETGALRAIAAGGGLVALVTRGMESVGIQETQLIRPGAVGVIERATMDGANLACAICTGERWVSLGLSGIDAAPAEPIKAWRTWERQSVAFSRSARSLA